MKKNKYSLNIWEGQYVRLTLKNSHIDVEGDDGNTVSQPYHIDGTFIWWDKDSNTVHMNTANSDANGITLSIDRSLVGFIEIAPIDEELEDVTGTVN